MTDRSGENNPFYGKTHTDETKLKISRANKGRKLFFSKEHRRLLSESNIRRNHRGENHPFWGKKMNFKNPEQRSINISLAKTGKTHKGTPHTKETKEKISLAHMGKKMTPESIRKRTEKTSGEKAYQWKGGFNSQTRRKYSPRPQPDQCDICAAPASQFKKRLSYDHDHATGKFRGWLCVNCNIGLGNAKDSVEILLKMIVYLKKNGKETVIEGTLPPKKGEHRL